MALHRLMQSKNNIRALELRRYLGVCHRTAWLVKHRLIKVVRLREDVRQLTGRVEIDDAYLGGERSGGQLPDSADGGASAVAPLVLGRVRCRSRWAGSKTCRNFESDGWL